MINTQSDLNDIKATDYIQRTYIFWGMISGNFLKHMFDENYQNDVSESICLFEKLL